MRYFKSLFHGVVFAVGIVATLVVAVTLESDVTLTGYGQGDLVRYLQNVRDNVNEMTTDHATNKTTMDENRTAILELIDDHDTNQTHLANLKTLVNSVRNMFLNKPLDPWNGEVVSNFDVRNGDAMVVVVAGKPILVTTDQVFDTGTSTVVTTNEYWAAAVLSVDGASATPATSVVWGAENVAEAGAITNLASVTPGQAIVVGYITVRAAAAQDWVAGTDAITTGTGGQVAQNTNYYNISNIGNTAIGSAVSTSEAAALSAGDPTASAATLTNSTALTLSGG